MASPNKGTKIVLPDNYQPPHPAAKRWLILAVVTFGVAIMAIWGWSLRVRLSNFKWEKAPEKNIVDNAQSDWDKIFAITRDSELQRELNKIQMKEIINQALANRPTNSTMVNTTVSSATTTATSTPTTSTTLKK